MLSLCVYALTKSAHRHFDVDWRATVEATIAHFYANRDYSISEYFSLNNVQIWGFSYTVWDIPQMSFNFMTFRHYRRLWKTAMLSAVLLMQYYKCLEYWCHLTSLTLFRPAISVHRRLSIQSKNCVSHIFV